MNITPRADEWKPVVALMESGDYDSAPALAKAIVKAVYDEILKRDWFAWVYRFPSGEPVICRGPFSSEKEVEKYVKKLGIDGEHLILAMGSPHGDLQGDADARTVIAPPMCSWCGHPKYTHDHKGYAGKCACRGCACRKYLPPKES